MDITEDTSAEDENTMNYAVTLRKKPVADAIPRSSTFDGISSSDVKVLRHPITSCRPQSNYHPSTLAHPHFHSAKLGDNLPSSGSQRRILRNERSAVYELSQDLQDKQLELLERKYGGRFRARHAALVIQRAYRRFSMQRKFDRLSVACPVQPLDPVYPAGRVKSHYDVGGPSSHIQTRVGMTRSTSATARIHANHRYVEVSPSTGLYDNIHTPNRIPSIVNQSSESYSRTVSSDVLPPSVSKLSSPDGSAHGAYHRSAAARQHRSRFTAQSESPVRIVPNNSSSAVRTVNMSTTVSICDVPSFGSINAATQELNTSPVWKRLDGLDDQDSGVGSSGGLNSVPTHKAFVDYDNVPFSSPQNSASRAFSSTDSGLPLPFSRVDRTSPRRNSDSYRAALAVNGKSQQRRAASASRVPALQQKHSETRRKRQYRVGLNLFNKKPEKGIAYLVEKGFISEATPYAVARFLITRKGLSKQKIGEYLGLASDFCIATLQCFAQEIDLCGLEIDQALRKFQTYFRLPGEAQKIERVIESFSDRYFVCNPRAERIFQNSLTVLRVAYGIILLNTDLHNPSIKKERKMKPEDFLKNMKGALGDNCGVDDQMLRDIYSRVKTEEFKPGTDHVSQVQRVDKQIIGDNKPILPLPHRRLVCFCRLYEVYDENRKERAHQREVFLFNDLIVITKQNGTRKKNAPIIYRCRMYFPLVGTDVQLFSTPQHPNGLRIVNRMSQRTLVTLNARNEHDRSKFAEDLQESVKEMDEMESMRIEGELEKQNLSTNIVRFADNRDSGVADVDDAKSSSSASSSSPNHDVAKRSVLLSNSLLDMSEQQALKQTQLIRRLSTGSLDSGMCMPGSSVASTQSTPSSEDPVSSAKLTKSSLFGSFFSRKSAKYNM